MGYKKPYYKNKKLIFWMCALALLISLCLFISWVKPAFKPIRVSPKEIELICDGNSHFSELTIENTHKNTIYNVNLIASVNSSQFSLGDYSVSPISDSNFEMDTNGLVLNMGIYQLFLASSNGAPCIQTIVYSMEPQEKLKFKISYSKKTCEAGSKLRFSINHFDREPQSSMNWGGGIVLPPFQVYC